MVQRRNYKCTEKTSWETDTCLGFSLRSFGTRVVQNSFRRWPRSWWRRCQFRGLLRNHPMVPSRSSWIVGRLHAQVIAAYDAKKKQSGMLCFNNCIVVHHWIIETMTVTREQNEVTYSLNHFRTNVCYRRCCSGTALSLPMFPHNFCRFCSSTCPMYQRNPQCAVLATLTQ